MNIYIYYIFFLLASFFIIFFSKKYEVFQDNKIELHKRKLNKSRSLYLGGLIFIIFLIYRYLYETNISIFIFILTIFFTGFLSDLKFLNDPKKRFIIQFFLILIFVYFLDINILKTRFFPLDILLENKLYNYFFVVFCLMILLNGSNFIDGINTLAIGYFLTILITLNLIPEFTDLKYIYNDIFLVLIFLLILNLLGIIILGDSGAYAISLFFGIFLIEFANLNESISPFFIILLLWYPCFELLFSMIRRISSKKMSYKPDLNHLHQLIYLKINSVNTFGQKINHFISSLVINSYIIIIFYFSLKYVYETQLMILFIFLNIIVYCGSYFFLKRK